MLLPTLVPIVFTNWNEIWSWGIYWQNWFFNICDEKCVCFETFKRSSYIRDSFWFDWCLSIIIFAIIPNQIEWLNIKWSRWYLFGRFKMSTEMWCHMAHEYTVNNTHINFPGAMCFLFFQKQLNWPLLDVNVSIILLFRPVHRGYVQFKMFPSIQSI